MPVNQQNSPEPGLDREAADKVACGTLRHFCQQFEDCRNAKTTMGTLVKKEREPQLHLSTRRKHPSDASTIHISQLAGQLTTHRYDIAPLTAWGPLHLSQFLLAVVILLGDPVRTGSAEMYVNQRENVARLKARLAPTSWCPPTLLG